MKNIILLAIALHTLSSSWAQVPLEARSFSSLREELLTTAFHYRQTGRMFGFLSTQSCMYENESLVVFRNYCFPVRSYPAQGYTIFSRDYGVIRLYEETTDSGFVKRDIFIDQFPAILAPYLNVPLPSLGLSDFSQILADMYESYFPGCWSTNFSFYHETNEANCSVPTDVVDGFASWAQETQALVNDDAAWAAFMRELDRKFIRR